MDGYFGIGQVARMTGISIKAIRYYEAIGVLPPPMRSEGRYRLYYQQDIHRLHFLKLAKELGFSLRKAGELLALADPGCCTTVRPGVRLLLDERLRQIDARIQDLRSLRAHLVHYAKDLPMRMVEDAACTPTSCVPALDRPIVLLVGSVSENSRLTASASKDRRKP